MGDIKAVILAAGKGTRMKSDLPKVIHKALGKEMVKYSIEAAKQAGAAEICLVVGHKAELVKEVVGNNYAYVLQEQQLGTGHAVKCAIDFIGHDGSTLILCGDTPLITGATLKKLVETHMKEDNAVTVLSTIVDDSTGYGRIVRDDNGQFVKIVEQKDANEEELNIKEINSGMYIFESSALKNSLNLLNNDNAQGEYYLTDTLEIIKNEGFGRVSAMVIGDSDEIKGVNSPDQLKEAEDILSRR